MTGDPEQSEASRILDRQSRQGRDLRSEVKKKTWGDTPRRVRKLRPMRERSRSRLPSQIRVNGRGWESAYTGENSRK